MNDWPPKESILTDRQKDAYRYILYQAFVDIRNLCQSRGPASDDPAEWYRQYGMSRKAGALADWLHGLAFHASIDFRGFSEDWFWQEYADYFHHLSLPGPDPCGYRRYYEEWLARPETPPQGAEI